MRILVVEDDLAILELLSTVFRRVGIEVDSATDGATALRKLRCNSYSVLLLDLMLPVINGFEVVRELRSFAPLMLDRTIVLTAASESTLRDFDRSDVFELVRKPFDLEPLIDKVVLCAREEVRTSSYSLRMPLQPS